MCLYSSAHIWKSSAMMRYVYLLCHFSEFQAILSDLLFGAPSEPPTFCRRFRRRFQEALVQSQVRFNGVRRRFRRKRQVRVNRVSKKVPEKVWEALVQSQVRFNRVPEKVPEKVWEALAQSQVRLNRVSEKVPKKVPGSLGAKPSQVQRFRRRLQKPSQVRFI